MLATLIIWAYSFALFYAYGWGGLIFLRKIFQLQDEPPVSGPVIVVAGMAILTTLASFLSLFIPLGRLAAILILIGGILIAITTRPWKKIRLPAYHFLVWVLLAAAGLTILENATHAPTNSDTALYHAQAIRWIESFRVVPGLANLHNRLGFNSSWFVLNAAFSLAFLGIQSFHLMNSVIMLVGLFYFSQGLQNILQRKITTSSIAKTVLFFLSLYLYGNDIASPSTDLPATLLTWMVSILLLEKLESRGIQFDIFSVVIFLLAIFALTVKLSVLPLAVIAFLVVLQQIRIRDSVCTLRLVSLGLLVLLPWLIRNIILSGYLVFPVSQIDIFGFDWKYPRENADANRLAIIWFARFPGKNWSDFVGLSFNAWAPQWFNGLSFVQRNLFSVAIMSPLILVLFMKERGLRLFKQFFLPYFVNYMGVIFWFLTAPDVRFGYGFLTMSIVLAFSPLIALVLTQFTSYTGFVTAILFPLLIFYQGYSLAEAADPVFIKQHLILPADYLPSRANPCPISNGTVFCRKEGGQCNYADFPCIPSPRPNVEMRGADWQDGFRTVQVP